MIPKDVTDMKEFEEYVLNLIEKSQDIGNELEQRIYQTNPTTTKRWAYFLKYIGIIHKSLCIRVCFILGEYINLLCYLI